jgi:hypothetical protein
MKFSEIRHLTVTEQSPAMEGCRTRLALDSSQPGSRRLASTRRSVRATSTICPTVITLETTKLLSSCLSTRRKEMPTRKRQTSKLLVTEERRLTTETARRRISRQRSSESRSRYWQTQDETTQVYLAVLWTTQGSVSFLSRSRCCWSQSF